MSARILDGNAIAAELKAETADAVRALHAQGRSVRLDAIMVGDASASALYARSQERHCASVGMEYVLHALPRDASEKAIVSRIRQLNHDPLVTGILLNLPLPDHVDTPAMQYSIDPYKDVEGVNPANIGLLFYDNPIIGPCTALAVMELLRRAGCDPRGMDAVVVGQGAIAGRPIALFLQHELATVTTCHALTKGLASHTQRAELLIVAVGKAGLIGREHVREGAVVIDVGINRVQDGSGRKTVGDVRFDEVEDVASVLTPVPGGVGPVTVAILLRNAVEAARNQSGPRRIEGTPSSDPAGES